MKIKGLVLIFFCSLLLSQSLAQEYPADGYQYVFPGQGAKYVHPNSTIIIRFKNISPDDLINPEDFIEVSGKVSGAHSGKTVVASDHRTLIFTPGTPFAPGERVGVTIDPRIPGINVHNIEPLNYEFTVLGSGPVVNSKPDEKNLSNPGRKKSATGTLPRIMSNGVSVPSDFPRATITVNENPSSDFVFMNNWDPPTYNIIFNTSGEPVWYMRTPDRREDFKVQANGWITMSVQEGFGGSDRGFIAFNQDFEFIKSMRAANGYSTNGHDFFMLPDNGYMLIGQRETIVDMSQYVEGGRTDATVRETCIQEFTADDQLIFIWRAWDHFDIRDLELECLTCNNIRFPHINAVYTDEDGHILISSRHLSEISKVHRQSGEFIWRMSGTPDSPNNDFKFERDPLNGFRYQHAIRSLGNNRYTLFDNGIGHSTAVSRAVEYAIDTNHMTATLEWEYGNQFENSFVRQMGNSQQLPNGNTHINWVYGAILPIAVEVTPKGEKVFEMWSERSSRCYRTFRYPWNGNCPAPYLLLDPQPDNLTLIFNKFGDPDVDYYNIYGGTSPNPTSLIDTSGTTLKRLEALDKGVHYYFRVTAVDKNGTESGYSNEEDLVIYDTEPGNNLILNGDFTHQLDSWTWEVDSSASAEVQAADGICNFVIENGGASFDDVRLIQDSIPLIKGQYYTLEFDAWAEESRIAEIMIADNTLPFRDYSRIGYTALNLNSKRYTYSFEMTDPTDLFARVVIDAGANSNNIYLDNISLKIDTPSGNGDRFLPAPRFALYPNYPNPFSSSTRID